MQYLGTDCCDPCIKPGRQFYATLSSFRVILLAAGLDATSFLCGVASSPFPLSSKPSDSFTDHSQHHEMTAVQTI